MIAARTTPTIPAIGTLLPALGGTLGAIMARPDGSVRGLIVSDAEHAFRSAWGPRKVIKGASGIDGMASTKAMAKAGSKAAKRILALQVGCHADWFLPCRLEFLALQQCAPQLFPKEWHWTSTQFSAGLAWDQYFSDGSQDVSHLDYEAWCRPVRSFDLLSFDALLAEGGAAA